MADKITYTDKEQGQVSTEPVNKRWNFGDANEVKEVVNSHADDIEDIAGSGLSNPVTTIDFFPQSTAPTYAEGRVWYDNVRKTINFYNDIDDVTLNIPEETVVPVWNDSGLTIANGSVVKLGTSAVSGLPTIELAIADSEANARVIGVATHDIEDGTRGLVTLVGSVGGVDTSSFSVGDRLFLSSTVSGGIINEEQPILSQVGQVLVSDAVDGVIYVIPRSVTNITAIGQVYGGSSHSQALTTTPTPCYAFDLSELELNVTVDQIQNGGGGYDAAFSPTSIGAAGFYEVSLSITGNSSSNQIYRFEVYTDTGGGYVSTNVFSKIDLSNNNIDSGNCAFTAITNSSVVFGQYLKIYAYTEAGSGTFVYESAIASVRRVGNV